MSEIKEADDNGWPPDEEFVYSLDGDDLQENLLLNLGENRDLKARIDTLKAENETANKLNLQLQQDYLAEANRLDHARTESATWKQTAEQRANDCVEYQTEIARLTAENERLRDALDELLDWVNGERRTSDDRLAEIELMIHPDLDKEQV